MRIWKQFFTKFILILFILFPSICTDALFTNELYGTMHYSFAAPLHLHNAAKSADSENDSVENIDNSAYKFFSLCTTKTLLSSKIIQINQSINRLHNQKRFFKFSFIAILLLIISGKFSQNSEYIFTGIKYLIELITVYIHKSDGKKRVSFC